MKRFFLVISIFIGIMVVGCNKSETEELKNNIDEQTDDEQTDDEQTDDEQTDDEQTRKIIIDTDFPGGNVIVDNVNDTISLYYEMETLSNDTVFIRPDLRDTEVNWFYWYFRIRGAENQTLHFKFPYRSLTSFGPAYSTDGGSSWQWLHDEIQKKHDIFSFKFNPDDTDVLFSFGIPYLQSNFDEFISQYGDNPYVTLELLTKSEKGRDVEMVHICHPTIEPKYKIIVTARHHACEAMASYVLEGLISSILSEQDYSWLKQNVEMIIIPFVDIDGVEEGDQGKSRMPRDHNTDYVGDYIQQSIFNSVRAIREMTPIWSERKLKIALDLHCPNFAGEWSENIFFVESRDEEIASELKKFTNMLTEQHKGQLKLNNENLILHYGESWNTGTSSHKFTQWISNIDGISLSTSLETPFANHNGEQVTPQNARLFGKDLAEAIQLYLQLYPQENSQEGATVKDLINHDGWW